MEAKEKGNDRNACAIKVHIRLKKSSAPEKERETYHVFSNGTQLYVPHKDGRLEMDRWYRFDHIYSTLASNKEVYRLSSYDLVESALDGVNTAIFAYGQTGSGKTHTLMSKDGVTAHMVSHLFNRVWRNTTLDYKVSCSYFQIHNENIYDLLNPRKSAGCFLKEENGEVYVENMVNVICETPMDVYELINIGRKSLRLAETKMGRHTCRSHAVCQLSIEKKWKLPGTRKRAMQETFVGGNTVYDYNEKEKNISTEFIAVPFDKGDLKRRHNMAVDKVNHEITSLRSVSSNSDISSRTSSIPIRRQNRPRSRAQSLQSRHSSDRKSSAPQRMNTLTKSLSISPPHNRFGFRRMNTTLSVKSDLSHSYTPRKSNFETGSDSFCLESENSFTFSECCDEDYNNVDDSPFIEETESYERDEDVIVLRSKISIIDLAGSERLNDTRIDQERLKEVQNINLSLLELGNVISALASGKNQHVPYRNSVLTRLLRDSLGENCKTKFLLCVSTDSADSYETRCTLDFGKKLRRVSTRPILNLDIDYKRKYGQLLGVMTSRGFNQQPISDSIKSFYPEEEENQKFDNANPNILPSNPMQISLNKSLLGNQDSPETIDELVQRVVNNENVLKLKNQELLNIKLRCASLQEESSRRTNAVKTIDAATNTSFQEQLKMSNTVDNIGDTFLTYSQDTKVSQVENESGKVPSTEEFASSNASCNSFDYSNPHPKIETIKQLVESIEIKSEDRITPDLINNSLALADAPTPPNSGVLTNRDTDVVAVNDASFSVIDYTDSLEKTDIKEQIVDYVENKSEARTATNILDNSLNDAPPPDSGISTDIDEYVVAANNVSFSPMDYADPHTKEESKGQIVGPNEDKSENQTIMYAIDNSLVDGSSLDSGILTNMDTEEGSLNNALYSSVDYNDSYVKAEIKEQFFDSMEKRSEDLTATHVFDNSLNDAPNPDSGISMDMDTDVVSANNVSFSPMDYADSHTKEESKGQIVVPNKNKSEEETIRNVIDISLVDASTPDSGISTNMDIDDESNSMQLTFPLKPLSNQDIASSTLTDDFDADNCNAYPLESTFDEMNEISDCIEQNIVTPKERYELTPSAIFNEPFDSHVSTKLDDNTDKSIIVTKDKSTNTMNDSSYSPRIVEGYDIATNTSDDQILVERSHVKTSNASTCTPDGFDKINPIMVTFLKSPKAEPSLTKFVIDDRRSKKDIETSDASTNTVSTDQIISISAKSEKVTSIKSAIEFWLPKLQLLLEYYKMTYDVQLSQSTGMVCRTECPSILSDNINEPMGDGISRIISEVFDIILDVLNNNNQPVLRSDVTVVPADHSPLPRSLDSPLLTLKDSLITQKGTIEKGVCDIIQSMSSSDDEPLLTDTISDGSVLDMISERLINGSNMTCDIENLHNLFNLVLSEHTVAACLVALSRNWTALENWFRNYQFGNTSNLLIKNPRLDTENDDHIQRNSIVSTKDSKSFLDKFLCMPIKSAKSKRSKNEKKKACNNV